MLTHKIAKWLVVLGICMVASHCQAQRANSGYSWFEQGVKEYAQTVPDFRTQTKDISAMAPEVLFGYAWQLFDQGEKEKSVFVYYLGQLRGRILLAARESATAISNEYFENASRQAGTAIIGKQVYLSQMTRYDLYQRNIFASTALGGVINNWAGANPDMWAKQMQAALDYENAHPFTPERVRPEENLLSNRQVREVVQKQKQGLTQLIQYVSANKEQILQERAKREAQLRELQRKM